VAVPARIVIAGGGFGGLFAARELERRTAPDAAEITLLNDANFLLYAPLLPGVGGGTLDPRHVVVPLREELRRTEVRVGRVTGADPGRSVVRFSSLDGEEELGYDHLVVALGSTSKHPKVPGLPEHSLPFKSVADALAVRNRVLASFEHAEELDDDAEHHARGPRVVGRVHDTRAGAARDRRPDRDPRRRGARGQRPPDDRGGDPRAHARVDGGGHAVRRRR
jgi:NADH dehydrogenase FAD-containing subunit